MRVWPLPAVAAALLTLTLPPAHGARNGAASPPVFVPWKVIAHGEAPPPGALVLYWIPQSRDDFRRSQLLTYRPLTTVSPQCVALCVVQADDAATIERLGATGKLPLAVLVSEDGRVIGEVAALRASAVDKLLRDEIAAREEGLDRDLDDAPKKLNAGDRDGAVALYRRVWEQRCLFPRHAREAERALKKLGVPTVAAAER